MELQSVFPAYAHQRNCVARRGSTSLTALLYSIPCQVWTHQVSDHHEIFKVELLITDTHKASIVKVGPCLSAAWTPVTQVFPLVVERSLERIPPCLWLIWNGKKNDFYKEMSSREFLLMLSNDTFPMSVARFIGFAFGELCDWFIKIVKLARTNQVQNRTNRHLFSRACHFSLFLFVIVFFHYFPPATWMAQWLVSQLQIK